MTTKQNKWAVIEALRLALIAPDDEKMKKASALAEELAAGLSPADLEACKARALELADEGEFIADAWEELDEIVTRRGLTAEEKDQLLNGVSALNMYQLVIGSGRFFEVVCERLREILPQLERYQEDRLGRDVEAILNEDAVKRATTIRRGHAPRSRRARR